LTTIFTLKKIYFTVTNDLSFDQRMHRICSALAAHGYEVTLVGRKLPASLPLKEQPFHQRRLPCWFKRGKAFYAEYNLRLFFFLLFRRMNMICAIDLDTIAPCLLISRLKRIPRVYDAHELFTELKEVVTRPAVHKMWTSIERWAVPQFKKGYTVCRSIAEEFERRYGVQYEVIRNVPVKRALPATATPSSPFLLYSGAVNEARGFEYLIPALKYIHLPLVVCGDGNFMPQLKKLISEHGVEEKVTLLGMLPPDRLWEITRQATIGIGIAENEGLNQYYALPNKFFDYIQAGLPQVTMDFPEYRRINEEYEVAVLIADLKTDTIATALNNLLEDVVLYTKLKDNCLKAREMLNWEQESKKLLTFYETLS
jgi:glycosyltransferase involved in cell wall biosynthesis